MDDCTLEKLSVKPGKLTPKFNKDVTEYSVVVGSNAEKINFDCLTSDTGASYCISGSGGGRSVPLVEGQVNEIKVEVTAEDGTIKNYMVNVRRLSAKDATLSDIKLSSGSVEPEFSPDVLEYYALVACDMMKVTVKPSASDAKTVILVDNEKPGTETMLSLSETLVNIHVTSPDGSNTQTYQLNVTRKQIPRYMRLSDPKLAVQCECPVSLNPFYRPTSIKGSDPKHTFSGPILEEFTKRSKVDPLNDMPLGVNWKEVDYSLDKTLSQAIGCIPFTSGGSSEPVKLSDIAVQLKDLAKEPKIGESEKFDTNVAVSHKFESGRAWEKQYLVIFDETDALRLAQKADEFKEKYFQSLPKPGWSAVFADGESPLDHLQHAAACYATAIKSKPKEHALHLKLGQVLEEKYYAEDVLGLKKEETVDIPSLNTQAKESSKEEECAAICQLRGVGMGAPLSLQLKAIDQEYHHLIESGQSGKADHVQGLFVWKSKQATQEGIAAQKVEDQDNPLGQAYTKYLDALSLDESKAQYHYHVGRMLVVQGNYEDAAKRLQAALGWNPQLVTARFYLGLALSLQKGGAADRTKEAMGYLREGTEYLLAKNTEAALDPQDTSGRRSALCAEDAIRNTNVYLLRGIIQMGKMLIKNPSPDYMAPEDVFYTAALVACQALPTITPGDLYQQVEWVLLEAHSQLLDLLLEKQRDNSELIGMRCERLSALIKRATIPTNPDLTALHQRTCQRLVQIQPCSSSALTLLGNNQLEQYDSDPQHADAAHKLQDAIKSFRAALGLEGKPAEGPPPAELLDQKWWQDKLKAEDEKKKAAEPKPAAAARGAARGGRGGAAGRGAPAARGAAATRGGVARGGRGAPAAARGAPAAARGAPAAARGAPAAARGAPAAARGAKVPAKGGAAVKPASKPVAATASRSEHKCGSSHKVEPPPPPVAEEKPSEAPPVASNAPINKKSYHPRLGLARALARTDATLPEAQKFYSEVIDLAPEVHDAYVESADMLRKTDPMAAVDVYCKFPVSENPTFDDAYIFGEIVQILMKQEKFDDDRLAPNMIALGRIMGIGCLEKYVNILENKFKTDLLKTVYAGVNRKDIEDPDMQAFFKFKFWI